MSFLHPDASARYKQLDRLNGNEPSDANRRMATPELADSSQDRSDPKDRVHSADPGRR